MTKVNPIQVQKFLSGIDYPVKKKDLIEHAKSQGADDNIISTLENLKEEEFQTPAEVSQGIGKEE